MGKIDSVQSLTENAIVEKVALQLRSTQSTLRKEEGFCKMGWCLKPFQGKGSELAVSPRGCEEGHS